MSTAKIVADRSNSETFKNTKRKSARPNASSVEKTALPEISKLIKTHVLKKFSSANAKKDTHAGRSKIIDAGSPNTLSLRISEVDRTIKRQ